MKRSNEQESFRWLAKAVGREVLPDPVWDVLVGAGHLRALREGKITEGQLIDYTRTLLWYGDVVEQAESMPEPRQGKLVTEYQNFEYEAERARTLASYLELRVAMHPSVLQFRRKWFEEGRQLKREGAYRLANLPEARVAQPNSQPMGGTTQSGSLELFSSGPERRQRVEFEAESILADLYEVSQRLRTELFPLWSEAEAAWVIVTGEVWEPPQPLIGKVMNHTNDHLTYGTINLTVEPWVSTESVVKAYQWLQAQTLGRKPRALIQRNLRVVEFVMGELSVLVSQVSEDTPVPPKVTWRKLMDQWNEANPEDAYDDERHFHRDFHRTANAVVRPYEATHLAAGDAGRVMASVRTQEEG
jgi:hypothetical protein